MSTPKLAIKIEGNSDKRCSAENSLALGEKRVEAVRKTIQIYGVNDSQLGSASWDFEHPKAQGHDETAWAQSRHADLSHANQ